MAEPDERPPAAGESPVTQAQYEELARFRYALRRLLRFSERAARSAGLTPQQHQLLLAVKGFPGRAGATVTDLAERLQVRHNSVVGILDRCAQAGLIVRRGDPLDRRQVHVELTPHGEEVLARLSRLHLQELERIRGDMLPGLGDL